MAGIELVVIDGDTRVRQFRHELEWNEVAYGLKNGFVT
jgi:L-arabinose isomerase